jgi:hypothetical protein
MNAQQYGFVLATTLAVSVAMPALGQTVAPAAGASGPDFSGIWAHPYLFPSFEQPESGRGPLVNKYRRHQLFDSDGRPLRPAEQVLVGNNNMLVADDADPILKSHAAEAVRKHGEIELNGSAAPNPSNQCWPEPMPYILWNFGMQMLQRPDQVIILYDEDHEFRQVRMNQAHPAEVAPSWYGDSVGHYEGETLVIDTVGVKVDRPFAMIDMFGTPYTSALHVVERYRLIDYEAAKQAQDRAGTQLYRLPGAAEGWSADPAYKGKGLQLEFAVEDEGVYTMSWSASMTYRRVEREWPETVCADNPHVYYAGHDAAVPRADKPDF